MPKTLKISFSAIVILLVVIAIPLAARADLVQGYEKLYDPLPSNELVCPTVTCDLRQMALLILRDILQLVPIASVVAIIFGGFQMVASSGNEERVLKAKRTIFWAIAGLVFAFLSFSIIAIVQNLLGAKI